MAMTPIDTRPITAEIERLQRAAELAREYNAIIDLRVPLEAVEANGNGHAPAMTKGQKIAATRRANAAAAAERAERARANRSAGQRARRRASR